MQIRPKVLLRFGRQNEPVRVPSSDLIVDAKKGLITVNTVSASSTLTVKNISDFAINQILLIGEIGNQGSEIIKTHASTTPTGTTVTLASNTSYPHSASTTVYILPFDQVEITNAPTLTGTKTGLSGSPFTLVANSDTTKVNDVTNSSGYYFARFKNSITAVFSSYSDPAPYGSYTPLTARSIINSALGEISKDTSETLTDEFAFQQIDNCQYEVLNELKRWSWMQQFDYSLGETSTGTWKVAVPTDLSDQNTNKSIYNFRIGKETALTWVDKEKWDEITVGTAHTTLAVAISVSDATVTLTDSSDFDDAGTLTVGANSYPYTANNRTTNVITLTSVSTTTNTILSDVFSGAATGLPTYWTTFGGYLYHFPVTSSSYTARNYYLDYYKSLTQITKDSDTIVIPDPTVVQYYLQWKFLKKLNNGEENAGSTGAMTQYKERKEKLKQKEVLGKTFVLKPQLNSLNLNNLGEDKRTRLGAFENI